MDDAVIVRGFERLGNLPREFERLLDRNRSLAEATGERLALYELHYETTYVASGFPVRRSLGGGGSRTRYLGLLDAVNRGDVPVVQGREDPRLTLEAPDALRVGGKGGREHLDGDVAAEPRVARAIDFAHPADADALLQPIDPELVPGQERGRRRTGHRQRGCGEDSRSGRGRVEQRLHLLPQRLVARAGLRHERRTLIGPPCQGVVIQLLDPSPAGGIHLIEGHHSTPLASEQPFTLP
jgi:hypothetical protein